MKLNIIPWKSAVPKGPFSNQIRFQVLIKITKSQWLARKIHPQFNTKFNAISDKDSSENPQLWGD